MAAGRFTGWRRRTAARCAIAGSDQPLIFTAKFADEQERRGEEKMNRKILTYSALSGALVLAAANVGAQEATPEPPPPPFLMVQAMPEDGGPLEFGERIEVLGFGGLHGGKVVKGAPFSAVGISESTQTLTDGNRITRKTQTALFRDDQGRFRKEVTLPAIGPLAASGQPHSFVVISDPVAGASYVLEADEKVARKMSAGNAHFKDKLNGEMGHHHWKEGSDANVQKESLGTQSINGIKAEGTRYTRTIAAGEIGNDKPITIVSERWYSPDLQVVVMSKHSDPRFGNSSYTLTNIQRSEPDASLFGVPAGYTVKEGGPEHHLHRFIGPPPDAPPPPAS
jgi:hypothetical protein